MAGADVSPGLGLEVQLGLRGAVFCQGIPDRGDEGAVGLVGFSGEMRETCSGMARSDSLLRTGRFLGIGIRIPLLHDQQIAGSNGLEPEVNAKPALWPQPPHRRRWTIWSASRDDPGLYVA